MWTTSIVCNRPFGIAIYFDVAQSNERIMIIHQGLLTQFMSILSNKLKMLTKLVQKGLVFLLKENQNL